MTSINCAFDEIKDIAEQIQSYFDSSSEFVVISDVATLVLKSKEHQVKIIRLLNSCMAIVDKEKGQSIEQSQVQELGQMFLSDSAAKRLAGL